MQMECPASPRRSKAGGEEQSGDLALEAQGCHNRGGEVVERTGGGSDPTQLWCSPL